MTTHTYRTRLVWDGNTGDGTASYDSYERDFRLLAPGKPAIAGSADPAFRGDATRVNPEDLLVGALAACHMLFYLALAARRGLRVLAYEDDAIGVLAMEPPGGGRFAQATLRPRVTIADASAAEQAAALHDEAHRLCFLARSCNFPIHHEAAIAVAAPAPEACR